MRTSTLVHLALLCLLAACRSSGLPPLEHPLAEGVVRAQSQEQVDEAVRHVRTALPRVLSLPGTHRRPLVLHVVDELPSDMMDGATFHVVDVPRGMSAEPGELPLEWIEIASTASPRRRLSLIAHELTHFYLGEPWDPLPQVIEEGLAQVVSMQVDPRYGAEIRVENAVALATAISGGLTIELPETIEEGRVAMVPWWVSGEVDASQLPSAREALTLDARGMWKIEDAGSQRVLYGLGYLLASRIGTDALFELCLRANDAGLASIPPEWVFERAGLDPEHPEQWRPAIRQMLGADERLVFARRFDQPGR